MSAKCHYRTWIGGTQVSKEAHARPSRLHHSATCVKNILFDRHQGGSHWTIKDVSIDAGVDLYARPNASADLLVGELQKAAKKGGVGHE